MAKPYYIRVQDSIAQKKNMCSSFLLLGEQMDPSICAKLVSLVGYSNEDVWQDLLQRLEQGATEEEKQKWYRATMSGSCMSRHSLTLLLAHIVGYSIPQGLLRRIKQELSYVPSPIG